MNYMFAPALFQTFYIFFINLKPIIDYSGLLIDYGSFKACLNLKLSKACTRVDKEISPCHFITVTYT